jgi:tetratricopeptide (TPR) repeat protein
MNSFASILPIHPGITIMFRTTLISCLTLAAILLGTAHNTRAELSPSLKSSPINPVESNRTNNKRPSEDRRVANDSEQSMKYTRMGWESQKNGETTTALKYYTQAVELDPNNGYAFMAAGSLLGQTKEGILCMKAAAMLFKQQGNQEGYTASVNLLGEWGIPEEEIATAE